MKTTLRKLPTAWPLVIFLLFPALARGETAVQAWVQRYNGVLGSHLDDRAHSVAVDGSNNVVVTGYSDGNGSASDYATIKYSSDGVPLWADRYNGRGNDNDSAYAVAVDGSNNVIVAGCSTGSAGDYDYATIKYSADGVVLWTNRYNGPGNGDDRAVAVAVDGSNSVIVTGYSATLGDNPYSFAYATIKYSSAGVPLWTNRYNSPGSGDDSAVAVAVDGSNNVIVSGTSDSDAEYATIKYSSDGVPLWTNRYSTPGSLDNIAAGLAVDRSNNVVVTGSCDYAPSYSYDYATIKYSSDGVPLWTNCYHSIYGSSQASAVAADGSNNVTVTGHSTGSRGNYDYATIKYSSAGLPLWTNRYNGPGNGPDYAYAVAVDGKNNVIVTGFATNSASGYDYATIKYSGAGVPLWTNRYNGPGNGADSAVALAVDHSGNVIVTGGSASSSGVFSDSDFATIKYICVPQPVLAGLQSTNGGFQLRVDAVAQPATLVIEASTNLSSTNWAPVFTNTTPTNVLFYTDPKASNYLRRFYRAFQSP